MKANKLMIAALFMGTLAMVSCSKKEDDPVVIPGGGGNTDNTEAPEVEKPADGYVTFVINIPAGSECNGIAVKGTTDGANWTGENQYLAADGSIAAPADAAKFVKVEGNWYKTTIKLGAGYDAENANKEAVTNYLAGKICLIYTGDGSWQGQAENWEYLDDTNVAVSMSGDGNIQVNGTQGIVYVKVGNWQKSECETVAPRDAEFVVTILGEVPAGDVIFTGNFDEKDWANSDRVMTKNADGTYTWKGQIPGKGFKCKVFVGSDWAQGTGDALDGDGNVIVPDDAKFPYAVTFTYETAEE